jgi:hypothetical protein
MSLYEVSHVVAGQSVLARALIRDLQPVKVLEVKGTRMLKQWDRIGARLIWEHSEWRMGGGVLLFERVASDFLMEMLRSIDGKLPDDLRKIAIEEHGREAAATIDKVLAEAPALAMMAPTFSGIWLAEALERALNPQIPELCQQGWPPAGHVHIQVPVAGEGQCLGVPQGVGQRAGSGRGWRQALQLDRRRGQSNDAAHFLGR